MKKLIASTLCLFMLVGIGEQSIRAEETPVDTTSEVSQNMNEEVKSNDPTIDKNSVEFDEEKHADSNVKEPIKDGILSKITADSIKMSSGYLGMLEASKSFNSAYEDYKDYKVLYQQHTGINTLDKLYFSVEVDGVTIGTISANQVLTPSMSGYTITLKLTNPAEDKKFIETAQDFIINAEITVKNKEGESVTVVKELPAKVVKVVGKIINRKAIRNDEIILPYNNLEKMYDSHIDLKVELLNGTIINTLGLWGQRGSMGGPNGQFAGGSSGPYDLKYILEDAKDSFDCNTNVKGYLIDDYKNIVDVDGKIVIPFDEREIKKYESKVAEIRLSAKVGTLPDSAVLESTKRDDLNLKGNYIAYDMNVMCNGGAIQPVGSVDLSIKIPENLANKKLVVYYMDEQGKMEEMKSTINGDTISFSTTHFSTYVVMEKEDAIAPADPITPTPPATVKPVVNETNKKVESVQTGDTTMPFAYISLLVVSAGILLVLKKKSALKNR